MARRLREDLTEEEIRQIRARKKRKKIQQIKRRIYGLLFLVFIFFVAFYLIKTSKDAAAGDSVSENSATGVLPTSGATDGTESVGSGLEEDPDNVNSDENEYYISTDEDGTESAMRPYDRLDVTLGHAAINFDTLSGNSVSKVAAAKQIMATQAYFPGTTRTVNDYLSSYGEGKWHGINGNPGEICVFYEGEHVDSQSYTDDEGNIVTSFGDKIEFKVIFNLYEDGSFSVLEVDENGLMVDDYESWLKNIVG